MLIRCGEGHGRLLPPAPPAPQDGGGSAALERTLAVRLTGFVGHLRENGFPLGVEDAALLVDVASRIGVLDRELLRWSAQALLCRHAADQRRFAELFDAWFMPPNRRKLVASSRGAGALQGQSNAASADSSEGTPVSAPETQDADSQEQGSAAQRGASREELLAQADFQHLHQPHEMRALDTLMRSFARRLAKLALRRQTSGGTRRIDVAGTVRRSVSHGGEPLELMFRQRRRLPPRLILLIDVSRSMSLYSFFFLRLARALQAAHLDTRVFIWHTHLSGVSEALRDPDPWRAQERLQLLSAGWAGGTRIGASLQQLEREHGALIHSRTALIVVSDGYDTGDPTLLGAVVRRLRSRARRFIWLNPLAARDDYQPLARGMQAVLGHLDLLAPANNLASIERVLPAVLRALA